MSNLRDKGKLRRRRRILDAARRLVAEHGVEGLSVRKIAEDADVSVATLYNLHGSREQILYALLEESFGRLEEEVATLPGDDPIDAIRASLRAHIREYVRDAAFYRPLLRAIDELPFTSRKAALMTRASDRGGAALLMATQMGVLTRELDVVPLSRQIFLSFIQAMRHWALGEIDGDAFEAMALYGLYLVLAAAAAPASRPRFIGELRALERRLPQPHSYS